MEELGKKESRKLTMDIMVRIIVGKHPDWKDPMHKSDFSDYVIKNIVGDFMNDPQITGSHEEKKNKAKELYLDIMDAWEEAYGVKEGVVLENGTERVSETCDADGRCEQVQQCDQPSA